MVDAVDGGIVGTPDGPAPAAPRRVCHRQHQRPVYLSAISPSEYHRLVAAATVSDAWFVALMALFVLWVSGLRYGPAGRATNLLTSLLGAFWGTVGLGLHRVVRDGVFIRISHELLEQIVLGELPLPTVHRTELLELVTPARVAELVYQLGTITEQSVVIQANGALDQLALYGAVIVAGLKALQDLYSEECLSITVPVGTFEGQEAAICLEDTTGDLTIGLAGGDFWIGKFWNSGVMNPLAVFPNLIVTISWVLICGYVSALLPLPRIRTVRQDLTRVLLPQVLQDAAWYLSLNSDSSNTAKRTNGSTTTEDNINSPADSNTNTPKEEESALTVNQQTQIDDNKRIVRKRLMKAVQILKEGKLALVTVFEPRLWDNCGTAPRNTFLPLQELASKVEQMALKALAVQSVDPVQSQQVLQDTIVELQRAAKALEDPATETFAIHANKTAAPETDSAPVGDPFELARLTMDISTATHDWLESMYPAAEGATRSPPWNDGTNDGAKHVAMTGAAWVLPGLLVPARLLQILLYPIQLCRNGWDSGSTEKTLQCIKFTIGFTALVSLSVFVEGYREFTVTNTQSSGEGSDLSLVRGNPPSSFSNWDLVRVICTANIIQFSLPCSFHHPCFSRCGRGDTHSFVSIFSPARLPICHNANYRRYRQEKHFENLWYVCWGTFRLGVAPYDR